MRRLISNLPNFMTLGNLFCGALATVFVMQDRPMEVAILIGISLLLDFGDGLVARALKVSSPMGKELDSLADMVSFGLVPGLIMAHMLFTAETGGQFLQGTETAHWWWIGLLIPVFSGWRLAKFNLDTRQSDNFYGVPTPAISLLVLSLWLISNGYSETPAAAFLVQIGPLVLITLACCVAMVMDVRLIALKFKDFSWKNNRFRYLLIGGSVLLLVLFQMLAVPCVFLWYLILSFSENIWLKTTSDQSPT